MPRRLSRSILVGVALAAAMALGACRDTGKGEGKLFEISGKLFVFNYRLARATYVVTLRPLQPMGDGQVAVASFQDPAGGAPFVVEQKVWPKRGGACHNKMIDRGRGLATRSHLPIGCGLWTPAVIISGH